MTKINVSINDIFDDMKIMIKNINQELLINKVDRSKIKIIVPCRGGEVIASLLKNALGLSEGQMLRLKISNTLYSTGIEQVIIKDKQEHKVFCDYVSQSDENLTIFIDDLVDSGATIDYIKDKIKGPLITTVLYSKEGKNKEKVDFCVRDLEDKWLVFPWEDFYLNEN